MDTEHPDQPFFGGLTAGEEKTSLEGKRVIQGERPAEDRKALERTPEQKLHASLMNSTSWGPFPCVENQDIEFPDTIQIVKTHVESLDLSETDQADRLAVLLSSDKRRGTFKFIRPAEINFVPAAGKYIALVAYEERKFKQVLEDQDLTGVKEKSKEEKDEDAAS